jgi:hypothetical protein
MGTSVLYKYFNSSFSFRDLCLCRQGLFEGAEDDLDLDLE